jgi:hypothetical protein
LMIIIIIIPHGWGARPFIFFSPVQTGLPRDLAKLLTHATQPGLVSPDGGEQAQRYHSASLWKAHGDAEPVRGRRPRPPVMDRSSNKAPFLSFSLSSRDPGIKVTRLASQIWHGIFTLTQYVLNGTDLYHGFSNARGFPSLSYAAHKRAQTPE